MLTAASFDSRALGRFFELHARLAGIADLADALDEILAAAAEVAGTDRSCIHLSSADGRPLELVAQRGCGGPDRGPAVLDFAGFAHAFDPAKGEERRLIVEDVETFPLLLGTKAREVARGDGVRAVHATPMVSRDGLTIGVLSTLHREPHRPSDQESRFMDLLASAGAACIERVQMKGVLRTGRARQAFLLRLSDAIRPLGDPDAVRSVAARVLGEHLGVDRVAYAEDEGDGETVVVRCNYTRGVPGIEGRYRTADYGRHFAEALRAGRTVVRPDIPASLQLSRPEKAAHEALQVAAALDVPLVKNGRLCAILGVHYAAPHDFSAEEIALCEEVAERTWAAAERARAEAALRASEARYKLLFDSIDQGFCVVEMLFDAAGRPYDYRFLQVNAAFTRQTGLVDPLGRTAREMVPDLEPRWYEIYGSVALTGEPRRFVETADAMGRCFEVFTFRVGRAACRQVGILFKDVSERVLAEEQQRMLVAELDHRVKNMLATVQAIAQRTLDGSNPVAVSDFVARIAALAQSHAALAANRWKGAALMTIVGEAVAPFARPESSRVRLEGPRVRLQPKVAETLAMAFHELATNAAKYGALSREEGSVACEWRVSSSGLTIDWREAGGPPIEAPPERSGFGTMLIDRSVTHGLGGRVSRRFERSGLAIAIDLPATGYVPEPGQAAPAVAILRGAAAPAAGAVALEGRRILVVEDQALIAEEVAYLLRQAGCEVIGPAGTTAQARRLMLDRPPCAAVLDINVGGEMVWSLALDLHAGRVPIVFASGYSDVVDPPLALAGAPRIAKPVSPSLLRATLAQVLGAGPELVEPTAPDRPAATNSGRGDARDDLARGA
jgi:two-component sensor histidine kinase